MALSRYSTPAQDHLGELAAVFSSLDDAALLARLQDYRPTGRLGYPLKALWRAYVASFILNLPHTNALIRRLEDEPDFRYLCGFFGPLPHRTTFNRFIQRLSHHVDLVEACFADLTHQIKMLIPDLGAEVAVDATTVRSHCNPNRKRISDPEASWTAKNAVNGGEIMYRQGGSRAEMWRLKSVPPVAFNQERPNLTEGGLDVQGGYLPPCSQGLFRRRDERPRGGPSVRATPGHGAQDARVLRAPRVSTATTGSQTEARSIYRV